MSVNTMAAKRRVCCGESTGFAIFRLAKAYPLGQAQKSPQA